MRNDLKKARLALGLTQAQVAERIKKDQGVISRYETGHHGIDPDTAPLLASVLGLDVITVLYGPAKRRAA